MGTAKPRNICTAILGAGQSRRFGAADKLAQTIDGTMLGLHIAGTLNGLDCRHRLAVASAADHPCADGWRASGFTVAVNENAADGLGTSVALAAKHAANVGADALLICLADMPFVPLGHLEQLIRSLESQSEPMIVASDSGRSVSPPAIFGKALYAQLSLLTGGDGARVLLQEAERLPVEARLLADIDTVAEFLKVGGSFGEHTAK